jgi:hypothetical protein
MSNIELPLIHPEKAQVELPKKVEVQKEKKHDEYEKGKEWLGYIL